MKFRKAATALTALALAVSLAACGGGGTGAAPASSAPSGGGSQSSGGQSGGSSFPTGQITIVIPWSAGGASDTMARLVAEPLNGILGVPVVVTNQTGASGTVGTQAVATAKPDGYTLLAHTLEFSLGPVFDLTDYTQEDFEWVARCSVMDMAFVTRPGREWSTMEEFVAYAKEHPGQVKCGTAGAKSAHSVCLKMLSESTGCEFMEVPYDGGSAALAALLGDNVDFVITAMGETTQYVNDGDMELYAIMGTQRSPLRPDTPTFTELGYENMEFANYVVFGAPKGTPADVMETLRGAFAEALSSEELYQKFWDRGQVLSYLDGPSTYEYLKETSEMLENMVGGD